MLLRAILILLLFFLVDVNGTTMQAQGYLYCNGTPLADTKVVLMEWDNFDPHDVISTTTSKKNGYFFVSGNHWEIFKTDWFIVIYHSCTDDPTSSENCIVGIDIRTKKYAKNLGKHFGKLEMLNYKCKYRREYGRKRRPHINDFKKLIDGENKVLSSGRKIIDENKNIVDN